jgi:hypothetical protein
MSKGRFMLDKNMTLDSLYPPSLYLFLSLLLGRGNALVGHTLLAVPGRILLQHHRPDQSAATFIRTLRRMGVGSHCLKK